MVPTYDGGSATLVNLVNLVNLVPPEDGGSLALTFNSIFTNDAFFACIC